ncbi:MAG: hypothetical protein MJZ45_00360 [Bacteroidales bacterium]|nr:hypothetical protein [Bacteroidales bacterium]
MTDVFNWLLPLLTIVSGGGWLFDRRRHRQEVESLKADNKQKDMELSKLYVDEFRSNIAEPLLREVKDLKEEIARLKNAIQKISDCPRHDRCPVLNELQEQSRHTPSLNN